MAKELSAQYVTRRIGGDAKKGEWEQEEDISSMSDIYQGINLYGDKGGKVEETLLGKRATRETNTI